MHEESQCECYGYAGFQRKREVLPFRPAGSHLIWGSGQELLVLEKYILSRQIGIAFTLFKFSALSLFVIKIGYEILCHQGLDCCSDTAIAFHYVDERLMYLMEYLLYQLRPYGMKAESRPNTPEPPPDLNLTATPWIVPDSNTNEITQQTPVNVL